MSNLQAQARALSAQVAKFGISKKKKGIVSPFFKQPRTLSERVAALGTPRPIKVVEKPMYFGKPGEKGDSIRGEKGKDGHDGRDGRTPIKGVDYLTSQEMEALKQEIKTSIKVPEQQKVELPKPLEVDTEFVKKIVQIMHTLPENDKLEVSKGLRNAQSFLYGGKKYQVSELMHGGGSSSTSGGITIETPTGTVNAVNTVFTPTKQPLYVISDGITYVQGNGYSWNGTTITLDIPPSEWIRDAISS